MKSNKEMVFKTLLTDNDLLLGQAINKMKGADHHFLEESENLDEIKIQTLVVKIKTLLEIDLDKMRMINLDIIFHRIHFLQIQIHFLQKLKFLESRDKTPLVKTIFLAKQMKIHFLDQQEIPFRIKVNHNQIIFLNQQLKIHFQKEKKMSSQITQIKSPLMYLDLQTIMNKNNLPLQREIIQQVFLEVKS